MEKDSINYILSCYNIHSIKRISDGEVFTVGDKVTSKYIDWNNFFIDSFDINSELILKVRDGVFTSYYPLKDIKHAKKPVLTTEDGVDLYMGDNCVSVNLLSYKMHSYDLTEYPNQISFKYFSNRQVAEQYIINNKPVLSLFDVLKSIDVDIEEEATLTDLVRSRL